MKTILQKTLALLAKLTLWRYKPVVIGITGSVGKTSTREAIFTVLRTKYRVRRSEKNYNTEIGVPLTILGIPHYDKNIFGWLSALARVAIRVLVRDQNFPEILILEMGADRPGDIKNLCRIAPPFIAVLTAIGEIPAHVEFFAGPLEVAEEKAELLKALPPDGFAVINGDDEALLEIKERTKARKISFGFDEHADVRISNYEIRIIEKDELDYPDGISFKIENDGNVVPVRIHGAFGKPHAYAAAAAAAVARVLNMNLVEVSGALEEYGAGPGRGRLIRGIKGSFIIDDTYNASPESMRAGLELLQKIPGKRKIAVLGDMLEIGKYTEEAHRVAGDQAAEVANLLLTVGERAKYIADEATTRGVEGRPRVLDTSHVFVFDDAVSAGRALDPMIQPGDIIFVKGSRAMHMEKVVEEVMAEPEKAEELLVH
ncbi:MAG: UDP-N-acetylmuramoyl-tripeptide--D-alanyl-D-alanine ligase [Candidatus Sungiibacteriota bacterium]